MQTCFSTSSVHRATPENDFSRVLPPTRTSSRKETYVSERPPIGYSDHCCVEFSLLVDVTEDTTVRNSSYYLWCRADFPSINEYLAYIDWYNLFVTSLPLSICGQLL